MYMICLRYSYIDTKLISFIPCNCNLDGTEFSISSGYNRYSPPIVQGEKETTVPIKVIELHYCHLETEDPGL